MAMVEVKKLTPAQRAELRQQLLELEEADRKASDEEARKAIQVILAKYGTTLERLGYGKTRGKATGKTRKVGPKYRDKQGNTWAGIGQVAKWLKEAMNAGINPDGLLVKGKEHSQAVLDYWNSKRKK